MLQQLGFQRDSKGSHPMPLPCRQAEIPSQCAELQPLQGPACLHTQAFIGACCCNAAQVVAQPMIAPI
jgi:hypothetical protein